MSSLPKLIYKYSQYNKDIHYIADNIEFNHVIGIYRGSLPIATHLSNIKNVKMSIIGFQTRDGKDKSPAWIINKMGHQVNKGILLVDDIYDTGTTMKSILKFINVESICLFWITENCLEHSISSSSISSSSSAVAS